MEKELLTDLTAIVTLSRECEALLLAVDDHFRNVSTVLHNIVRANIYAECPIDFVCILINSFIYLFIYLSSLGLFSS